jgi:hypothetical protein
MVDWGNVPAFIAATLTGLSLIIAALTYRRAQRNSEREQASMVAGWIDTAPDPEAPNDITGYIVRIRNASKLPIYDVYVERPAGNLVGLNYPVIRPEDTVPSDSEAEPNISLIAGMKHNRTSALEGEQLSLPRFTFHDAAGRLWLRDELGRLTQKTRASPWWSRWRWRPGSKRELSDNARRLATDPNACQCGHSRGDHHEAEDSYAQRCLICDCEYFRGLPPAASADSVGVDA